MKADEVIDAALLVQEFRQLEETLKRLQLQDADEACTIMCGNFMIMVAGPWPSPDAAKEIRKVLREDYMKRQNAVRERLYELKIELPETEKRNLN